MTRATGYSGLLVIAVFLGMTSISQAEEIAAQGVGTLTCRQFANMYRGHPELVENVFFTWAQGFMTGVNYAKIAAHSKSANLGTMTTAKQKSFIRSYCDAHPSEVFLEAVTNLYFQLPRSRTIKLPPARKGRYERHSR
jgi:hypothetical protein